MNKMDDNKIVNESPAKAFFCATSECDIVAKFELGRCYEHGKGVPKD